MNAPPDASMNVRAHSVARRLVLLPALLALAGCFSLSRDAPAPRHYVLGPNLPVVEGSDPERPPSTLVGLRTPRLSDYLVSPFVVVRQGAHEVGFSRFDLWGEGLAQAIGRSVSTRMGVLDPTLRVVSAPWSREARPDYLVELQVVHFEGIAPDGPATQGEAHLLVHWEILRPADGTPAMRGTTEMRSPGWPVGDYPALVALLEAGLSTLAEDLAAALGSLEPANRPGPPGGLP
jgi:uncharacterized lipoprotein YmbA